MYNLIFTNSAVTTRAMQNDPLTGEDILVDINSIPYDELPTTGFNIKIKSIKPQIEDGVLKSLMFEITKFDQDATRVEKTSYDDQTMQAFADTPKYFMDQLSSDQKNIIEELVERIDEYDDLKIYCEDYRRAHFAIKYNGKSRAKAWLVIKQSGANLFLWIRVDPNNYTDLTNLSKPYRDDSKTHGNRIIKLTFENLNDIMDLVRQSYEFRKLDDFYDKYTQIVQQSNDEM